MHAASHIPLPEGFSVRKGELHIDGIAVTDCVGKFGTPLYAYSTATMAASLQSLKEAYGPQLEIYYSMKANPNPAVVGWFVGQGCGIEVASQGELETALAAGCSARDILFAGPGKTAGELERACRAGIGEIHVESLDEIALLGDLAARHASEPMRVALRVNPVRKASAGAMQMGGRPSQFGIDEEHLVDGWKQVQRCPSLRFSGVHMFVGTQILDADTLAAGHHHALEVGLRLTGETGDTIGTLDLGGGLGVPYFEGEQALDLERLKVAMRGFWERLRSEKATRNARVILEPGRFLVAPAGVYLTRVIRVKESRGKRFVITDGGMNHHLAASGNLGQVIRRNFPMVIANRLDQEATDAAEVVGPLCTPLDTLGRNVRVPPVEPGDILAVLHSGAYGLTASPIRFLSHPPAAECLVDRGSARAV